MYEGRHTRRSCARSGWSWRSVRTMGMAVARCPVERLMRELGLVGARRGKRIRTTIPGAGEQRAGDLLRRDFTAPAPNRLWVVDFTHVAAWFERRPHDRVVDIYSCAIVSWAAATYKWAKPVSMPWTWRCGGGTGTEPSPGPAWCTTAMPDRPVHQLRVQCPWLSPGSMLPSAPLAIPG
jgi:hypothetical protein